MRDFNHVLQLDVVILGHGNVLHFVGIVTGYQNGSFISKLGADTTWRTMRRFRINVYEGTVDYIYTDPGTNFNSVRFKGKAESKGTIVKNAPTEAHDLIRSEKKIHVYLRIFYDKLYIVWEMV